MSYSARVFKIMIASPSDVNEERNIAREVIYEWNAIHSESKNIVLLPVGWETHSSPEMGMPPQEIINKQILEKCDVLVGIFWTRIGTKTGEYASGTVEEIEKHIQQQKLTMIYFSNKPINPDSINQDQKSKLDEFKVSCQNRGLYQAYSDLDSFRKEFSKHLQLKINESSIFNKNTLQEFENLKIQYEEPSINLSQEALTILREASQDSRGVIFWIITHGGTHLKVNRKNLISDQSRRSIAKWESALQELVDNSFIEDKGENSREYFEITDAGFKFIDPLDTPLT